MAGQDAAPPGAIRNRVLGRLSETNRMLGHYGPPSDRDPWRRQMAGTPRGAPTGAFLKVQRLLGAPHPSHWGEGKRDGPPPPDPSEGPAERWLFLRWAV